MKYIRDGRRGWDHEPYWSYLDSIKGSMPAQLFEFASAPENHNLSSPNSLHDSWLELWQVKDIEKNGGTGERLTQVDVCFLGPKHDRRIHLTYREVESHSIRNDGTVYPTSKRTPHGDMLVHEVVVVRNGLYSHELIFSKGVIFSVQFSGFEHRIEALTDA